jgi:FtsZ-interacting cell division protein ZipA
MSENKSIGIIVAAGCGIALIVIVGIVLSKNAKATAREQEVAALAAKLNESVSKSTEYIRDRDFERATSTLQAMEPSIVTIGDYSLRGQYDQALSRVADAERDYKAKVKNGWAEFEGKFISPGEKQRVIADRKRKQEEHQHAEHERKLAEAREQNEAAKRQRREEQRETQERKLEYEVIADETQDTPGKSQVLLRVIVPEKPSPLALRALLQSLFDQSNQRVGFEFRQHPNAVYIFAYAPNSVTEGARLDVGTWIGFLSYNQNNGDTRPEIRLSDMRLEAAYEEPTILAGLSEQQRKEVFWELEKIADRATVAFEKGGLNEMDRIKEQGERELMTKYGLTQEQLLEISLEGVKKGWPVP